MTLFEYMGAVIRITPELEFTVEEIKGDVPADVVLEDLRGLDPFISADHPAPDYAFATYVVERYPKLSRIITFQPEDSSQPPEGAIT